MENPKVDACRYLLEHVLQRLNRNKDYLPELRPVVEAEMLAAEEAEALAALEALESEEAPPFKATPDGKTVKMFELALKIIDQAAIEELPEGEIPPPPPEPEQPATEEAGIEPLA